MTIFFPDVSQYTPVSLAGAPVAIARAAISNVTDTHWQSNVDDAAAHQVPLLAYAFLNSGSLGVSAEAQADYAYSVIGRRPTMLDHEPNRGACATLAEACRWIDRFRSHGGVVHLHYLPKWTWSNPAGSTGLGKPGLGPLAERGMLLVASNYTTYSDTGPGWAPYYAGCPVPVAQWQYSFSHPFNGVAVDWNAFRGTVAQYLALASGDTDVNLTDPVPSAATPDVPNRTLDQVLGDLWRDTHISMYAHFDQLIAAANTPTPVALTDADRAAIAEQVVTLIGAKLDLVLARLEAAGVALAG